MMPTGKATPHVLVLSTLTFTAFLLLCHAVLGYVELSPWRAWTADFVKVPGRGLAVGNDSNQAVVRRVYPHLDPTYAREAEENVSLWRATIFQRTTEFYSKQSLKVTSRCEGNICDVINNEPDGHLRFTGTDPFITCPPGQELKRWGEGDGGKFVCGLNLLKAPCMVLSIGGNNQYEFEEGVLAATPCQIATFDCTVEGRNIHERHKFFKKCLGSDFKASTDKDFITVDQAADMAGTRDIALLKMDIEGYEYDILAAWKETTIGLPQQLCLEVHFRIRYIGGRMYEGEHIKLRQVSFSEIALFFNHMVDLGYGIVSREDNPLCDSCSEYTLYRVA